MDGAKPQAKSSAVSNRMRRVRRQDTTAEMQVRSLLHRLGLRYRVHIRPLAGSSVRPDIVFTKARVAVFIDGCFWHACPKHASWPKTNAQWWKRKILANVERDRRQDTELRSVVWRVSKLNSLAQGSLHGQSSDDCKTERFKVFKRGVVHTWVARRIL